MHENSPRPRLHAPAAAGRRGLAALAAALACGASLAAMPPAWAAAGHDTSAAPPGNTALNGVSVVSSTNAWAVGYANNSSRIAQSLTLHWNGTSWTKIASPSPGGTAGNTELTGVSADSATDAWAVGYYQPSGGGVNEAKSLILHWNGTSWKQVPSPNPGGSTTISQTELNGVSATSATDAWAAGYYRTSSAGSAGPQQSLLLHWNGTSWTKVPTPGSPYNTGVMGVSALSGTNAWAGGYYSSTGQYAQSLTLHLSGSKWTQVSSPSPGGTNGTILNGVSAHSATDVWGAGFYSTSTGNDSLILHWNGTKWAQVTTPNPGGTNVTILNGVSAHSATDAWAAGFYAALGKTAASMILHWNGTSWKQVTSPSPAGTNYSQLTGVGADSATDAWAVGYYATSTTPYETFILHWNGTSWTRVPSPN